jgi:hypothetical protein
MVRNVGGPFSTVPGVGGGWFFRAPPGTWIEGFRLHGALYGVRGWQATLFSETTGTIYENCPGATCPGAAKYLYDVAYPGGGAAIFIRVRCGSAAGCPNNAGLTGYFRLYPSTFTLADLTLPAVAIAGGSVIGGGWIAGTRTLAVSGADNTGIAEYRASIDGALVSRAVQSCNYTHKAPCPSGRGSLDVPTAGLRDGDHTVTAEAVDAGGNVNAVSARIRTDNTPPTQPLDVRVAGGAGWRATSTVKVSWTNPPQAMAPIAGARYWLCPSHRVDVSSQEKARLQARCVSGSRAGANLRAIDDLKLPGPGLWRLELWLIDAAGNQEPASATSVDGLGFDDTPPADIAFAPTDPQNPTRIHVRASEPVSGIAAGTIEARRDGEQAWRPLATEPAADGLTAVINDEILPKGLYFLRARVVNAAGLEASDDRDASAQPAILRLPLRLASRITAGGRGARTCRGHGRRRSCRHRLVIRPSVAVGRSTRLFGRLTLAGRALPGAPVEVWRRLALEGAGWVRIATLSSSRTGRFAYLARRGPARTIRFRYPGTPTIRGRNSDVALRVRATTSIRSTHRTVINGEYVTFRGRLKGGWIPPAGALVELQVFSRGHWRTFAQPRARATTGRWAYRYRFETVRGRAVFRFRARIRRQPGLPFTTGASRTVRVNVRGL